jgi:hypothetical protein
MKMACGGSFLYPRTIQIRRTVSAAVKVVFRKSVGLDTSALSRLTLQSTRCMANRFCSKIFRAQYKPNNREERRTERCRLMRQAVRNGRYSFPEGLCRSIPSAIGTSSLTMRDIATSSANVKQMNEAVLLEWCALVRKRAQEAIGTYKYGWPELGPDAVARHGDTPLLHTASWAIQADTPMISTER